MCAIVDANVAHEVFGSTRPPAGKGFFDALNSGSLPLVESEKVTKELEEYSKFKVWARRARSMGILRSENEDRVFASEKKFQNNPMRKSDDPHILALAMVSGARLLYSNDKNLHKDFKKLLAKRGKVYSTNNNKKFDKDKRRLIRDNICPAKRR